MGVPSLKGVIGLSGITLWKMTDGTDVAGGTAAYGAAVAYPGVAELNHDSASSQTPYYGDDGLFDVGSSNGFRRLSLKLYDVKPDQLADILGLTYADGQIVYTNSAVAPYFAVAATILRNGVGVTEKVLFYKVQFMQPKDGWKTKGASISFVEVQLEGAPVSLISNSTTWIRQRSDDTAGSSVAYSAWNTTPQVNGANLNALNLVATQGGTGASSTIIFTFAKTGGASFRINAATMIQANLPVWVAGASKAGTYVDTTAAAGVTQVVTFTPTAAFAAAQKVLVTGNSNFKDNSNVGLTTYSTELTLA